ncbi:hypothetical protein P4E94_02410 [Pontiellaceae bacterium B12219]|nr:hypothetical protein [Pontiellaceae bacterium B12219]
MKRLGTGLGVFLLSLCSYAQEAELEGCRLWRFILQPDAKITGAYDTRAYQDTSGAYDSGFYSELSAETSIKNEPAKYSFSGFALYGIRHYDEFSEKLSPFYNFSGALSQSESAFQWKLYASYAHTLTYQTAYDPSVGLVPGPILTSEESTQIQASALVAYDKELTEKMSLKPAYVLQHYDQSFETQSDADWQTHDVSIQLRRKHDDATVFTVGAYETLQVNSEEDGNIVTVMAGMEREVSEKIDLLVEIGYAYADYEVSGSGSSMVSNYRGTWNATDQLSLYIFGGTDFLPGYDASGATLQSRLGYGGGWKISSKIAVTASLLHNYQEAVDGAAVTDPWQHFATLGLNYQFSRKLNAGIAYQYNRDGLEPDQQVGSVSTGYAF